jgi:F0F1-type ATP synthase assembly protein I
MAARRWLFVVPLLLFTTVCAAFTWLVLHLCNEPFRPAHAGVIAYLTVVTWVLHAWQEGALASDPKGFVRRFMTGLVLKMFASIVLLVALVFMLPREEAIPLAVAFSLLYLAYLAFSTVRLSGLLRRLPKPPANPG